MGFLAHYLMNIVNYRPFSISLPSFTEGRTPSVVRIEHVRVEDEHLLRFENVSGDMPLFAEFIDALSNQLFIKRVLRSEDFGEYADSQIKYADKTVRVFDAGGNTLLTFFSDFSEEEKYGDLYKGFPKKMIPVKLLAAMIHADNMRVQDQL